MVNILRNLSEPKFLLLLLTLIFIYCSLLALQGLDLVDEGWCLSTYQQLLKHPQYTEPQMQCYNGMLLGAIWNAFFESWGMLGFRLLKVIIIVFVCATVYLILRKSINRWCVFLGLVLVVCGRNHVIAQYHNMLSILIIYLSIIFLCKALDKGDWRLMFITGTLIGINIFTRIPNIAMLGFFLCLVPFYFYTKDWRKFCLLLSSGVGGVIIGVALEVLLLWCLGHLSTFEVSISSLFSVAQDGDSGHSLTTLAKMSFHQYEYILKCFFILWGVVVTIFLFCQKFAYKHISSILSFVVLIFLYIVIRREMDYRQLILYSFCFFCMSISLLQSLGNSKKIYLISAAVICMIMYPLGSDCGIFIGETLYLSVPLCIGLLHETIQDKSFPLERKWLIAISIVILMPTTFSSIKWMTQSSFHDRGLRWHKTEQPIHPGINVYTDKFKCELIDEALNELDNYIKPGDVMLCWPHCPIFHYFTKTYPYLSCSWPWIYTAESLEKHFQTSSIEIAALPLILCNKSSYSLWFKYNSDWDSEDAIDQVAFPTRKVQLFNKFILENGYETVWENEVFRIMLPPGMLLK